MYRRHLSRGRAAEDLASQGTLTAHSSASRVHVCAIISSSKIKLQILPRSAVPDSSDLCYCSKCVLREVEHLGLHGIALSLHVHEPSVAVL